MKITQVKTYEVQSDSKVKALATITLDDCFVITGIKIIDGSNGLYVAMPNRKTPQGEYKDTIYPITKEFRQILHDSILNEFKGIAKNEQEGEYITIDDTTMDLPF